ncbi:kinetochore protein [Planoprotostelium fungivorum]|uniref:Kinetochore protein NDC80 n=1 Tax=Planoprotostelium fungivorum TaxID=1890364 RepID=A0A2P6NKG0_9EUKA|nr:kinetochore protein [Planoprotostelium fungivorum]
MASRQPLAPVSANNQNRLSMAPQRTSMAPPSARKSLGPSRNSTSRPSVARTPVAPNSVSRPSMGSGVYRNGRPSNVYGKGKTAKSDPRNITDPAFKQMCVRTLLEYAFGHGYSGQVSVKILNSPTTKDFIGILTFLYNQIDPNYTIVKLEEDAINLFKSLRYPVNISKSALQSVGTMHTWPNLLAALHWFVELLVFYESRINIQIIDNEGQIRFDELYSDAMENNEQKVSSLIMDVTVRAYEQWLIQNIDDRYPALLDLEAQFQEYCAQDIHAVAAQEAEKNRISNSIEDLLKGENDIPERQQRLQILQEDSKKFQAAIDKVAEAQAKRHVGMIKLQENTVTEEAALEQVLQELAEVQGLVEGQQAIAAELDKLLRECNSLDEQILSFTQMREERERGNQAMEASISRKMEEVEKQTLQYNNVGRQMKIIPSTCKKAKGTNYQIVFDHSKPDSWMDAFKNTTRGALVAFRNETDRSTALLKDQKLSSDDQTERTEESIVTLDEEIRQAKSDVDVLNEKIRQDKEAHKVWTVERDNNLGKVRAEIKFLNDSVRESVEKSNNSLTEMKGFRQQTLQTYEKEKMEATNICHGALERLIYMMEHLKDNTSALHQHALSQKEQSAVPKTWSTQ